jgi:cysteinyl-tRNA synthetase
MTLQIYNTLTRRTEPFETIEPSIVRMYVCGVTVYDSAHIGHAMSAVAFDVVRRYLEWSGYTVQHIVNFTDVDDKIIARAKVIGQDPQDLANQYINEFMGQIMALNVLPATSYPRATQTMKEIITFIDSLIDQDHAYAANGDVYFRVKSFPFYGQLSGRSLEDMLSGTRFEVDERKESPADFALWKGAKAGEPAWPSPWGNGRPGWHIECSAMNLKHLGEQIDIHGGGSDLVFPHHENEIAQSESLTGKPFARYWMHNGMLQLLNAQTGEIEKMSKSLGNLVTIDDFLSRYDSDVFRLIVLNSHYRRPLTYNDEIAAENARKRERLLNALLPATGDLTDGEPLTTLAAVAEKARANFREAMDDDFNTPAALATLFELVRAINSARDAGVGEGPLSQAQAALRELGGVLGLRLEAAAQEQRDADPFVDLLVEVRAGLRKAKQFELADTVRQRLSDLGVTLEDTAQGTRWKYER